jgi:hypothetical protein
MAMGITAPANKIVNETNGQQIISPALVITGWSEMRVSWRADYVNQSDVGQLGTLSLWRGGHVMEGTGPQLVHTISTSVPLVTPGSSFERLPGAPTGRQGQFHFNIDPWGLGLVTSSSYFLRLSFGNTTKPNGDLLLVASAMTAYFSVDMGFPSSTFPEALVASTVLPTPWAPPPPAALPPYGSLRIVSPSSRGLFRFDAVTGAQRLSAPLYTGGFVPVWWVMGANAPSQVDLTCSWRMPGWRASTMNMVVRRQLVATAGFALVDCGFFNAGLAPNNTVALVDVTIGTNLRDAGSEVIHHKVTAIPMSFLGLSHMSNFGTGAVRIDVLGSWDSFGSGYTAMVSSVPAGTSIKASWVVSSKMVSDRPGALSLWCGAGTAGSGKERVLLSRQNIILNPGGGLAGVGYITASQAYENCFVLVSDGLDDSVAAASSVFSITSTGGDGSPSPSSWPALNYSPGPAGSPAGVAKSPSPTSTVSSTMSPFVGAGVSSTALPSSLAGTGKKVALLGPTNSTVAFAGGVMVQYYWDPLSPPGGVRVTCNWTSLSNPARTGVSSSTDMVGAGLASVPCAVPADILDAVATISIAPLSDPSAAEMIPNVNLRSDAFGVRSFVFPPPEAGKTVSEFPIRSNVPLTWRVERVPFGETIEVYVILYRGMDQIAYLVGGWDVTRESYSAPLLPQMGLSTNRDVPYYFVLAESSSVTSVNTATGLRLLAVSPPFFVTIVSNTPSPVIPVSPSATSVVFAGATQKSNDDMATILLGIGVGGGALVLVLIIVLTICILRRRKEAKLNKALKASFDRNNGGSPAKAPSMKSTDSKTGQSPDKDTPPLLKNKSTDLDAPLAQTSNPLAQASAARQSVALARGTFAPEAVGTGPKP